MSSDDRINRPSVNASDRLLADPDYHVIIARKHRLLGLAVAGVATVAACGGNVAVDPAATDNTGGRGGTSGVSATTASPSTGVADAGRGDADASVVDAADADVADGPFDAGTVVVVCVCGVK